MGGDDEAGERIVSARNRQDSAPGPEQVERACRPSRVDRVISAVGWYAPEALGLLALLVAGWLVWTPMVVLAGLATVVRLAYHPVLRRMRQRAARGRSTVGKHPARRGATGRATGERDEGVAV